MYVYIYTHTHTHTHTHIYYFIQRYCALGKADTQRVRAYSTHITPIIYAHS